MIYGWTAKIWDFFKFLLEYGINDEQIIYDLKRITFHVNFFIGYVFKLVLCILYTIINCKGTYVFKTKYNVLLLNLHAWWTRIIFNNIALLNFVKHFNIIVPNKTYKI